MFVDRAKVKVTAGAGGDGCMSFRREKYVPHGGPNGGDGGRGGDVVFEATKRSSSLQEIKFHAHWKGLRGGHGLGKDMHGRGGEETVIPVPCGTLILDIDTGETLGDLTEEGQRFLAATGGKGGRGNARFVSSTNRVPRFAEKGEPGEEKEFILELKLIAEVGIVGLPNAGKSTLLSSISSARPKIANYPFTTLSPNLGVVDLPGFRSLTVADIPGIIEGAAEGKGLGHDFLRHIERTQVLLFLVDIGDPDPVGTREVLEKELDEYSPEFAKRPRFYALNKTDITENRERLPELLPEFPGAFQVSGATGDKVPELLEALWEAVEHVRNQPDAASEDTGDSADFRYTPAFEIAQEGDRFIITGDRVVRAVRMTNFDNEEAVRYFQNSLKNMGVFRALKRMGARPGHTIMIDDEEMEYDPD